MQTVIVLKIGNRYLCKIGKNKRVMAAWHIAGAKLFVDWRPDILELTEKFLESKGKKFKRVTISGIE
jgi:hypothetical protein